MGYYSDVRTAALALGIVLIVCLLVSVAGAVVLMATFLAKKNDGKFTGFAGWLYQFLRFDKLLSETILRVLYYFLAIFVTTFMLAFIFIPTGTSILVRILLFVVVVPIFNVFLRLLYESAIIKFAQLRNLREINEKMGKSPWREVEKSKSETRGTEQTSASAQHASVGTVYCKNCGFGHNADDPVCPKCGESRK